MWVECSTRSLSLITFYSVCLLVRQAGKFQSEVCDMAIALIEIMKLAEKLSADEQLELAAKLIEQVRKSGAVVSPPRQLEIPVYPVTNLVNQLVEDKQEDESVQDPSPFSTRHIPPEDFFVAQRRFVDSNEEDNSTGFDFSEIFDDDDKDSQNRRRID